MKKNLLVLLTASYGGGAEGLVLNQMKYYNIGKFKLHVITLRKGNLESSFAHITNVRYQCLNSKGRISLRAIKKIIEYIKQNRIDIVHTHLFEADMYGFFVKILMPGIKLITTKHNTNAFRKKSYWGFLDMGFSFLADKILAVSKSVKEFTAKYEHIPDKRISVVYHGVDIEKFDVCPDAERVRKELEVDNNNFVVGIVGRLTEQKGHKYLLQAIADLRHKIPNICLLIVGTGELREVLRANAYALKIENRVRFAGFREDMPAIFAVMDVLCMPSIFEGLGIVVIEAMLCNTIVVASRVDGIEEVIQNGKTGFLIPSQDSCSLVQVLDKIYQGNFDTQIITRARQRALNTFNFKNNLKRIEDIYIDLMHQ